MGSSDPGTLRLMWTTMMMTVDDEHKGDDRSGSGVGDRRRTNYIMMSVISFPHLHPPSRGSVGLLLSMPWSTKSFLRSIKSSGMCFL